MVGPGTGVPVEHLGARDQAAVTGEDGVARDGPRGHGDGNELCPGALGIDRDDHRAGRLAELVRGVLDRVGRPRRAHHRVLSLQALGEDEDAPPAVPIGVLAAQRRGPHVVQHRVELDGDLHWVRAVDLEEDEDTGGGRVPRREDVLADLEGRVAVGDGGQFGPDLHRARDLLAGDRGAVSGRRKGEAEAAADLERMHPELGLAGLHAEPRRERAGDAEVLARSYGAGELDGRRVDREAGDGERGQVGGRGVGEALGGGGEGEGDDEDRRKEWGADAHRPDLHVRRRVSGRMPAVGINLLRRRPFTHGGDLETQRRRHLGLPLIQRNERD